MVAGMSNLSQTICPNMVVQISWTKILGFHDRNGMKVMQ